jgi:hypothetical protein
MPMISYKCRHIMPSGAKCGSIALKDKPYCYAHTRLHRLKAAPPPSPMDNLSFQVLEDRCVIQVAITQVLNALCSGSLDPRRVGLALYGLQIASQNVDRTGDVIPFETVETMTETDTGEELGTKEYICDSTKCFVCPDRNTCEDCDLTEEEEEQALSEMRKEAAAKRALSATNRPKPPAQSAQPTVPSTVSNAHGPLPTEHCALSTVSGALPIVHAVASTAQRAPLHRFTSSIVHCPSSLHTVHCPLRN